jgi:glycosyltransferase involved in cell wall biosynthesis
VTGADEVTAVVPCFNYGRFLREAVDSVRGQEGGAPHVVVVDDGSTDEATRAVLDALAADGVEVVRQANAGPSIARNTGMARAETPLVLCLDADDRLAPGALRRLLDGLGERPEAGFAYGAQRFFGRWDAVWDVPDYDPLRLLDRHLIGPTALMRRELVRDTGGYDPAFAEYEDWEIWVNALAHGWRGVRVPGVVLEHRIHGPSKLGADRRRYRAMRAQLRRKHAGLYRRRGELARESSLGLPGRLAYRLFWGPRPLPAQVDRLLQELAFRGR